MAYRPQPDDVVLLASDGLCSLDEETIADIVKRYGARGAERLADELIAAIDALGRPDQDNTTVVVLRPADRR